MSIPCGRSGVSFSLLPINHVFPGLHWASCACCSTHCSNIALPFPAAGVVLFSPLPPAVIDFTRSFRLNEPLAAACRSGSLFAAAPLLLLLACATGALGLLPTGLPLPAGSGGGAAAAAATAVMAVADDPGECH